MKTSIKIVLATAILIIVAVVSIFTVGMPRSWSGKKPNLQLLRTDKIPNFNGIAINLGSYDVQLINDSLNYVEISGDTDKKANVVMAVKDGLLSYALTDSIEKRLNSDFTVKVHYTELNKITLNGNITFHCPSSINTRTLVINADGNADIDLEVNVDSLFLAEEGNFATKLKGTATFAKITQRGNYSLDAKSLRIDNCEYFGDGVYSASLNVSKKLKRNKQENLGKLEIIGNPVIIENKEEKKE